MKVNSHKLNHLLPEKRKVEYDLRPLNAYPLTRTDRYRKSIIPWGLVNWQQANDHIYVTDMYVFIILCYIFVLYSCKSNSVELLINMFLLLLLLLLLLPLLLQIAQTTSRLRPVAVSFAASSDDTLVPIADISKTMRQCPIDEHRHRKAFDRSISPTM